MSSVDFDESPVISRTGLLRSKVFSQIEDAILTGKYAPGDGLTEMRLSEEMKVSRTPIREALRQLELEGLVEYVPSKGIVVTGIAWQDIEDIYEIRMRIEGLAASRAAENITDEELKELKDVVDLTDTISSSKSSPKFSIATFWKYFIALLKMLDLTRKQLELARVALHNP